MGEDRNLGCREHPLNSSKKKAFNYLLGRTQGLSNAGKKRAIALARLGSPYFFRGVFFRGVFEEKPL